MRMLGVSQRRACRAMRHHRSTQRYIASKVKSDMPLVAAMQGLARRHPRYGYRRIHAMIHREGFRASVGRVHRLCVELGLREGPDDRWQTVQDAGDRG
jgi:transposase InsO family protein